MFSFNPLWKTLIDKGLTKTDLRHKANITPNAVTDMGKNKYVSMKTLDKLCNFLKCDISEVVTHIPENETKEVE